MSLSRSFALLVLVLVHPSFAGTNQNIVAICSAVEGTDGCTKNFNIPYDSRPLTTCGNKASPCGVEILTNSENICDMINDVLPNNDFVNGYATWCLALPDALRERKAESPIWTGGKVNGATTRAMNAIASIEEQGFADEGYAPKDNKASAISKDLANKDGWTVLQAAEVNITSYISLAKSIDFCQTTSCSQKRLDVIRQWFINWITADTQIRNGSLSVLLKGWYDSFKGAWKTKIAAISTSWNTVKARHDSAYTKFTEMQDTACQGNACKGKTAAGFIKQVSVFLLSIDNLYEIGYAAGDAENSRQYFLSSYLNKIQNAYNLEPKKLAPVSPYYDLVVSNKLETLRMLMNGFGTVTTDLDYYAKEMQANFYAFKPFKKHATTVDAVLKRFDAILAPDWKNNQELSRTPELRKVRDGFVKTQAIIKSTLQGPVGDFLKAIKAFNEEFDKFPLATKKLQLGFGAVPYQRWIDVEFDYPCRTNKEQTFTAAGFSKVYKWPEFSACSFTTQKIELVSNWIPYLKYRFA
ncbi:hypothetical protein BHE90_000269 [Fusarium euwallaceae]|uniref:Uncharacterized protein n=1 Tax=Fusarium euwallaceae TaxID=1147111 RepID=A0A430MB55_9HYPO|nr:hypothetical protein BHE90_000269 [Fusarium euwallaceae]